MGMKYGDLPKDQQKWLESDNGLKELRKYHPVTLYNDKDMWDIYEDFVKEMWFWFTQEKDEAKVWNKEARLHAYEKAYEYAQHSRMLHIMCRECFVNHQTVGKADEYFLENAKVYNDINWESHEEKGGDN